MIDKDIRMDNIKHELIRKIQNITDDRQLAKLYAEHIGCMDCTFQFTCDKRRPCHTSILHYLKTGEII